VGLADQHHIHVVGFQVELHFWLVLRQAVSIPDYYLGTHGVVLWQENMAITISLSWENIEAIIFSMRLIILSSNAASRSLRPCWLKMLLGCYCWGYLPLVTPA
jgi:hypothetical protein